MLSTTLSATLFSLNDFENSYPLIEGKVVEMNWSKRVGTRCIMTGTLLTAGNLKFDRNALHLLK